MIIKPKLEMKKVRISPHAFERVAERFNIKEKEQAVTFVKSRLANSRYIGVVADKEGDMSHMYTYERVAIYINLELSAVKSVVELDTHGHYNGLKDKIVKMYEKEFRKFDRVERSRLKLLEYIKVKSEADIAILKYKKYKTRSIHIKEDCDIMIINLNNEIVKLENEIKHIQLNKREIARAIATVVM